MASAFEARARMLATCLDKRFRSGKQAVEDATKACELHSWKDPDDLTALSAAYAEAGDFDAAFSWLAKADELAHARRENATRQRRLEVRARSMAVTRIDPDSADGGPVTNEKNVATCTGSG